MYALSRDPFVWGIIFHSLTRDVLRVQYRVETMTIKRRDIFDSSVSVGLWDSCGGRSEEARQK